MNVISGERAQTEVVNTTYDEHPLVQVWYELFYLDQFGQEHNLRVNNLQNAELMFESFKDTESIIGLTRIEKTPLRLKRWGTEWVYENLSG